MERATPDPPALPALVLVSEFARLRVTSELIVIVFASKSALLQLMKQFALENGADGLRFNSVAPGFVDGGMSTPIYADPKVRAARSAGVPLGRLATPEDIANAVIMLDSDRASYITGVDLLVDGGLSHALLKNLPRE